MSDGKFVVQIGCGLILATLGLFAAAVFIIAAVVKWALA